MSVGLDRDRLVQLAVAACVLNLVLVGALAGTGVLRTAERGDIRSVTTTQIDGEQVTVPEPGYVIEDPTDADFFYNIVVHVRAGGELYPGNGFEPFVQLAYKYTPIVFLLFELLATFGYVPFKLLWLLLSLVGTASGTYLLLAAETDVHGVDVSQRTLAAVAAVSVGFQPMVTNFKIGQSTPVMYAAVAAAWYLYRRDRDLIAGAAITGATVIKPYFTAPLVLFWRRDRLRGLVGFTAAFLAANAVGVAAFGVPTLVDYYEIILRFVVDEADQTAYGTFEAWTATQFRPFVWLGPLSLPVRLLLLAPAAYATIRYVVGRAVAPARLAAVSILTVLLVLTTSTVVDVAMTLFVVVLLGVPAYAAADGRRLGLLVGAFLSVHVHPYLLEALVGVGPTVVPVLAANEGVVVALTQVLQPATYGCLALLALTTVRLVGDHDPTAGGQR